MQQLSRVSSDPCKLKLVAGGSATTFVFDSESSLEDFVALLVLLDPAKQVTDDCEIM